MGQFQENFWTGRRTDRRTDGETPFYRTLLATAEGPIRVKFTCWKSVEKIRNI